MHVGPAAAMTMVVNRLSPDHILDDSAHQQHAAVQRCGRQVEHAAHQVGHSAAQDARVGAGRIVRSATHRSPLLTLASLAGAVFGTANWK